LSHGDVDQFAPHLTKILITTLQVYHIVTCALGELFIFVVMFFRVTVETFKVSQRHFTGIFLLLFFQPVNQHTELSSPRRDLASAKHSLTEELQCTPCRVTNEGGTQMTDVPLFRHVWCGVVNHNGLLVRRCDTKTITF